MNESLKERVIRVLIGVAPDIDPAQLVPGLALRDQVDFDSMDTLHFAIALKKELGIDVPDADFRELASVDRCVQYLQRRMQTAGSG
ncbi:MAG: acyl carrier protein [Steroidobacterales bacterium]